MPTVTGHQDRGALLHGGVFTALGHRDYLLYWSGALASNIGTWVQTTALFWYVRERYHSDAWVGAVNLANYLPVLFLVLYAGFLADVTDRKRMIMVTQGVMLLSALALGICMSLGVADLPVIMSLAAAAGVAFAFSFAPIQALLPDLVPEGEMLNALALSSAQFNLGRVIGPALGALIISAWKIEAAFYLNAASFALVIMAVAATRPRAKVKEASRGEAWCHIREGLRYVAGRRWMLTALAVMAVASFFGFSSMVLFPALALEVLGRGPGTYGLLLTSVGLGATAGAPLVSLLDRRLREGEVARLSCLMLGLCLVGLAASRLYWLSCVAAAGMGCFFLMLGSAVNTALQARSEHDLRGRVVSVYIMSYIGIFPLGGQVLGWLADWRSTSLALGLGGGVCVLTGVALFLLPGLLRDADSRLGVQSYEGVCVS
jgi:MFS family permease